MPNKKKTKASKTVTETKTETKTEVADQQCVRRSNRSRKATDFYIPEESERTLKRDKTRNKSDANKSDTVSEGREDTALISATKTNKKGKTTRQKKGRKAIGKLLFDYRNNRKRIPDYQKRLKYVERDPGIDILHKKLGLVSQRLSAISEGEEP